MVLGAKPADSDAGRAVEILDRMPIRRYSHLPLLDRIWQLRHNAWPYDAAYIALAEVLDAELITIDNKLSRIPGFQCVVRNLRDEG